MLISFRLQIPICLNRLPTSFLCHPKRIIGVAPSLANSFKLICLPLCRCKGQSLALLLSPVCDETQYCIGRRPLAKDVANFARSIII